jgi:hypothetical protein
MADPSLVAVRGPLESLAAGFVSSLLEQGYQRQSALIQGQLFAELSVWLLDEGLQPEQLDFTTIERFLVVRRGTGATRYVSEKATHAILTYLRHRGIVSTPPALPPSGPVESTLEHYCQYLLHERRLAATTARLYVYLVRPFVSARLSPDITKKRFEEICLRA